MSFELQIPMSREDQVARFLDQELIAELKRRGFKVVKPEGVCSYGAEMRFSEEYFLRASSDRGFDNYVRRGLTTALAAEMLHTEALEVLKTVEGRDTIYRGLVTILAPLKA